MKTITTIFALIKIGLFFMGIIPALIIELIVELIYPAVILGAILLFLLIRKFNIRKLICLIGFVISSTLSHIAFISNPGTDDSFSTLGEVVTCVFHASLFAIFALIFLIAFIVFLFKSSNKKITTVQEEVEETNTCRFCKNKVGEEVYCKHCGALLK